MADQDRSHPTAGGCIPGQAGSMIAVRGLCKGFTTSNTRIEILKDLDFDIGAGESVSIVGASGIGKSTFLHIIGTLDRPDRGSLWFGDEDIFSCDPIKLAKYRNESVGFVFQFHHLLPEFSAIENAMMPALINGLSRSQARTAAEKILVRVGLADRLEYRVTRLSGGEQQRVALARALVMDPVMLLADEPTGNLDHGSSAQVHDLLLELNRELNMTLVVVTHNLELAGMLSRSVTIIDGKLMESS